MLLRRTRRIFRGAAARAAVATAGAVAVAVTATATADAGTLAGGTFAPAKASYQAATPRTGAVDPTATVWTFPLVGRDSGGTLWAYPPNGTGGLGTKENAGTGFGASTAFAQSNPANTGDVSLYERFNGSLYLHGPASETPVNLGGGWNIYDRILAPGNLGGADNPDLLTRDTSGGLWLYPGGADGRLGSRIKVGSGWGIYNVIAGKGDLTGDGKNDIVARDGSGYFWLYPGTGNATAPFGNRVRIGTGWNIYNAIVSVGDTNGDGRADLIARDGSGYLWLYPGTGNAAAPLGNRVKIGSGWNIYNTLF